MEKLKCQLCDYETDKQIKLSKHTAFQHKLKFPDYLIQVKYKGINPVCECGCNKKTKYAPEYGDFYKFIIGHNTRKEGHWGDPKNPKRVEKIKATRKAKFASGEYDHIIDAIKNKDWVEHGKKISKGAKGVPKPRPEGFGIGRIHSDETRKKMSESAINRIIETNQNHTSKLEIIFAQILEDLNIHYIQWFYAKNIKAFYDFYLPIFNIIIEVDGDFWHCNPNGKYPTPEYETQKKNLIRDKQKNEWAQQNGFKLLRFWESDINNDPQQIIEILKKELNL